MKKLILPMLLLLISLTGMGQIMFTIQGTVTDNQTGSPVPNHPVTILSDSTSGFFYYQTVYTNTSGFFMDTVVPNSGVFPSVMYVQLFDCNQNLVVNTIQTSPSISGYVTAFSICTSNSPCAANFNSQQTPGTYTVQFTDLSVGGGNTRSWNFGDGSTPSTASNPSHTYAQSGTYMVTLTIGALGTPCYTSISQAVYVSGNGGNCLAYFYSIADSSNPNTVHFYNQSTGNILTYSWSFGDGTSSTLFAPSHTYAAPGTYNVCLTVHGADSLCYDVTCQAIVIGTSGNCHADFEILPDSSGGYTYNFINLSTGNITTWIWSFGDGTVVTVTSPGNPNVFHTYAAPGIYGVGLTVMNNSTNCTDMHWDTVYIGSQPACDANFTFYSDSLNSGNLVHFIDQSLGNIHTWVWNFGDPASGNANASSLQNPTHLFSAPGTYNVCLTIHGIDSTCYDMICKTVVIGGGPGCEANFTFTCTAPTGNTVVFTDLSFGNPVNWLWSFGDGTASTVANPVHTFASPGTYNVCLTIATNSGCSSTFCQPVIILDSSDYHHVYGQVFAGNFPLQMGMVMIFSFDSGANTLPYFNVSMLDSNGVYYFPMVPDGNYYIQAIPFDSGSYFPTYYGNTISWEQATLVTLGTPTNPYNINLAQVDNMVPGPGSTSGQINMGDISSNMIDKINMMLMDEQLHPISYVPVGTTGAFSFPSLAYGTYNLHAELPGVTSDYVKIVLSPDKPHANVVMTFTGNSILGLKDQTSLVNQWSVYPNPVTDQTAISINVKQLINATVEIRNLEGQIIFVQTVNLVNGNNTVRVATNDLQTGLYLLRIFSADGLNLHTKLVKSR